jgi:hypothetical protein
MTSSDNGFQIAILTSAVTSLEELPPLHRIEWLICRKCGEHRLDFLRQDTLLASLDFQKPRFDLPSLLAVLLVGDATECQRLKDRWGACFPSVELDFRCIPKFNARELSKAATAALADHLARQRIFSGRAALDLAVYRREFERLQRAFSVLEQYVAEHSLQKSRVLFEYPAGSATWRAGADDATTAGTAPPEPIRVQQHLPVDSLGVAGIAIDVRSGNAPLWAELRAIETDQRFAVWTVAANKVAAGWLHLTLRGAIDQPGLSLVLTLGPAAESGRLALGLGAPHPYERFRARTVDGVRLPGPLAMRIYGGLPGVRAPVPMTAVLPAGESIPAVTLVDPELCKSVCQVYPPPTPGEPGYVRYDSGLANITVHPRESGAMTVARLDLPIPANAWRVSAQIALEHEAANPTEFALMALPVAMPESDTATFETLDEDSPGFSGWIRLSALESRRISAFFPRGSGAHLRLYLLTRQTPGSSADFAWARFGQLEFNAAPAGADSRHEHTRINGSEVATHGSQKDDQDGPVLLDEIPEARIALDVRAS